MSNFLDKLVQQTKEAKELGLEGGFFLPGDTNLTPDEEKTLSKQLGWQKGDPIPDLSALKHTLFKEAFTDLEKNALNQGEALPTEIDFDKLPPKKQAEIKEFMKQAYEQHEKILAAEKLLIEDADPSINQAIASAVMGNVPELDLSKPAVAHEEYEGTPADSPNHPEFCPNCRYDITKSDVVGEPTTEESREFMLAMLSGKRFTKRYDFFGGLLAVTFRTLQAQDTDFVIREVEKYFDATGEPITQVAYHRQLVDYRKLLALESVKAGDNVEVPCSYDHWKAKRAANEPASLEEFKNVVQTKYFPNEPVYRQVMQKAIIFNMFIERLELRITDANFYKGIE